MAAKKEMTTAGLTYDTALSELEQLVANLEKGTPLSIDDYTAKAKRAMELIGFCREQLGGLEENLQNMMDGID